MIETEHGLFEIIKDDKNVFVISDFNKKFVELFKKYEYIVGDYNQKNLRLKGFNKENSKYIPDYINEYLLEDSPFYVLRNPNFDKDIVISEE